MPELIGVAESVRLTLGGPLAVAAGVLMLLFGRRLYWLVAGVVGFVVVFVLAERLLPELSESATLVVSVVAGVAGAVLVIFAHRLLLGLVGGLGGALVALWQAQHFGLERGLPWLLAAVVGGLLGAWLTSRLFEFALALLSSLLGAQLLVDALPVPDEWFLVAYGGLAAFGLFFQLVRSRRRKRHRRPRGD